MADHQRIGSSEGLQARAEASFWPERGPASGKDALSLLGSRRVRPRDEAPTAVSFPSGVSAREDLGGIACLKLPV